MKEMIYKPNIEVEVLDKGEYSGRKYLILSLGIYPTAYVSVTDKEEKIIKSSLRDNDFGEYDSPLFDDISVHCGFTFYGTRTYMGDDDGTIYLGWDYGHGCDYFGGVNMEYEFVANGNRWTTAEILAEVKSVIEQLNELEAFK